MPKKENTRKNKKLRPEIKKAHKMNQAPKQKKTITYPTHKIME